MDCPTVSSSRRLSMSWSLQFNWSLTTDAWKRQSPVPLFYLLVLCMSIFHLLAADGARVRHYRWEVSQQYKSPDCFKKLAVVVNGQSPGPTIRAQQGDTVVVEVKNLLHGENTAIHFHGIRQPGSYLYDTPYSMQRSAGLHGFVQVAPPDGIVEPVQYENDGSIIISDWWHDSATERLADLSSKPFGWVNEPQSLLINGRGGFYCSGLTADVCKTTNSECSPYMLHVLAGKTYRLRVSSKATFSVLNFEIEGHDMTVVEADGHYLQPFVVKNLNIHSGKTYSILMTANQDPARNYWIATNVINRRQRNIIGLGILHYVYDSITPALAAPSKDTLPQTPDLMLLNSRPRHDVYQYDMCAYNIYMSKWVDDILHNAYSLISNNNQVHSWHLHGHDARVMPWEGMFDIVNNPEEDHLFDLIKKNAMIVSQYAQAVITVAALAGWLVALILVVRLVRYENAPRETADLESPAPVTGRDGGRSSLKPLLFVLLFATLSLVILFGCPA